MYIRIFTIHADPDTAIFADQELHQFSLEHQILSTQPYFYTEHENPVMAVLVTYRTKRKKPSQRWLQHEESQVAGSPQPAQPAMNRQQNVAYQRLRQWRNNKAKELGYRPMNVLYNSQLLEVVRSMPASLVELQSIAGIGKVRSEKYGQEILQVLEQVQQPKPCGG